MEKQQFYTYLQDVSKLGNEETEELKQLVEKYPWFHLAGVVYLKKLKAENSPEYHELLKRIAISVPERRNLFRFLNSELPELTQDIGVEQASSILYQLKDDSPQVEANDSLIDRFLNAAPDLIRKKNDDIDSTEDNRNKELLSKSVTENDELITETLASIYLQQENYEKAQDAYRKLSLKYPEKSVYFAARIKEIEDLKTK